MTYPPLPLGQYTTLALRGWLPTSPRVPGSFFPS